VSLTTGDTAPALAKLAVSDLFYC